MKRPKSDKIMGIIVIIAVIILGVGLIGNTVATLITKEDVKEAVKETVLEYLRENGLTVNLYTEELKCNVTEINPPGSAVEAWAEGYKAIAWLMLGLIIGMVIGRL